MDNKLSTEELWNRYNKLETEIDNFKISLRNLKAFVQNDFDLMLEEGHTTVEEIRKSGSDFYREYERLGEVFNYIRYLYNSTGQETFKFIKHYKESPDE